MESDNIVRVLSHESGTSYEDDFIRSDLAWGLAGVFAFVATVISLWNVAMHLMHYSRPKYQKWIVRILLLVPIYAIISWLSMNYEEGALYYETIRDIYEAFVIYCFLALILEYVGGERKCLQALTEKDDMSHPCPCCCLPKVKLDHYFLRFCKQGTLQFVIIKPLMAAVSLIMLSKGKYNDPQYQIILLTIYNISYTIALYALLLFYLAIRQEAAPHNPVLKFFAVKIVVFATYWQGLIVNTFPGIPEGEGPLWNDFILCFEMTFFAIIHWRSFPWSEFYSPGAIPDKAVLANVKEVISIVDVVKDIQHNFRPGYKQYVLANARSNEGQVKYTTKTWLLDTTTAKQSNATLAVPVVSNQNSASESDGILRRLNNDPGDYDRRYGSIGLSEPKTSTEVKPEDSRTSNGEIKLEIKSSTSGERANSTTVDTNSEHGGSLTPAAGGGGGRDTDHTPRLSDSASSAEDEDPLGAIATGGVHTDPARGRREAPPPGPLTPPRPPDRLKPRQRFDALPSGSALGSDFFASLGPPD